MIKKIVLRITLCVLVPAFTFFTLQVVLNLSGDNTEGKLWPQVRPYKAGYLQVSKLHKIFYQLGGNPKGKPVMVLHGGPGAGCGPVYFRFFNPEKFHVVLHDQRGAGKSKPFAELKGNTTQHLVEDIEKLRKFLKLGPVILFGGSWGSTLALAYAETYPQNVKGMILRGIYTGTKKELDHFYHGGTALYFPGNYKKLTALIEHPEKKNLPAQLLEKLQSPDPAIRKQYALAWAVYEGKITQLEVSDREMEGFFKNWDPYAFSLIENYYMANDCFLKEGQLLRNAGKLADIPIIMVNGRYDVVCPPITAYKLHKKLPKSKLIIVEKAGHSGIDPPMRRQLVLSVREFE